MYLINIIYPKEFLFPILKSEKNSFIVCKCITLYNIIYTEDLL